MTQSPLLLGLSFYGETPLAGKATNESIRQFLESAGLPPDVEDEVPWCSAFLVWLFQQCCIETPANASALSWNSYSQPTDQPTLGDIVVLAWPKENPVNHHVGIFIRETAELVYILAGNQNNEVDITPWRKRSVLSYRRYVGS